MKFYALTAIVATLALAACSDGNKFKVEGEIANAGDSTTLYLEAANNGSWFIIDSVTTSGNKFSLEQQAPEFPNIYRLRMGQQSIYFPIDSIDVIKITTDAKDYAAAFSLSGSEHATQVMAIDKEALKHAKAGSTYEQMQPWKDDLVNQIISDPSSIVAYYIVNKYIGDKPLFDPQNNNDRKIIDAVTNAYNSFKPNDPRTAYMVEQTLQNQRLRKMQQGVSDTIVATNVNLIDIALQDVNGRMRRLSDEAHKDNVVVLNFTMYDQSFSPSFNKLLNDIYTTYHGRGLTIYQVALDQNMAQWKEAAQNLPWIAVYEPQGVNGMSVVNYNVGGVPICFIINRKGELVERVTDPNLLENAIARQM